MHTKNGTSDTRQANANPLSVLDIAERYAFVCNGSGGYTEPVSDDLELRKLNAILGSAIKALAESGADDEFIGAFALSHRQKVSRILGQPEEALQPPDLQAMITQAVEQAMDSAGLRKRASRRKTQRVHVLIGGRRTSVTITQATVSRLVEVKGAKQARGVIQELANSAPADTGNRSGWVEDRVRALLNFSSSPVASASQH